MEVPIRVYRYRLRFMHRLHLMRLSFKQEPEHEIGMYFETNDEGQTYIYFECYELKPAKLIIPSYWMAW